MASVATLIRRCNAVVDRMRWEGWDLLAIDRAAMACMKADVDERGYSRVPWAKFEAELVQRGVYSKRKLNALRIRYAPFFAMDRQDGNQETPPAAATGQG